MTAEKTAACFVDAINAHQVDKLGELITDTHVFRDSDGTDLVGRRRVVAAWRQYLELVPDYRIAVDEKFTRADRVVFLGTASGTFRNGDALPAENHWSVPAAWHAVVEENQVALWQVYVNPEPMRKILERLGAALT